ncbi:MAG: beta-ketoacyl-ACP reductase [Candidatus Kinetoplastibacterium crithidii]|nr:MAG: beta-ketoacyl-ACP reductase [Candidatus Kinetoplastibacterium crithidii]
MGLKGKVALVTGASRGIGKAIAKELLNNNAFVVGTSRSVDGVEVINSELSSFGGCGMVLDASNIQSCDFLMKKLSEKKIFPDILVNNAGINKDSLSIKMKESDWNDVINTNLSSIFYLSKRFIPHMMRSKWGRIINITSVVGSIGNIGQANYAASKAGAEAFSRVLAKEFARRGVTVNCVAPGFIDTDMTKLLSPDHIDSLLSQIPTGRFGHVDDVAYTVSFLASSRADYINGITLHVNGGMYMN